VSNHPVSIRSTIGRLAVVGLCLPLLAGCGSIGKALGFSKRPPDEFEVLAKAPLVVPPDYNLRPPAEEEQGLRERNPREMAFKALFPAKQTTAMPAVPAGSVGAAPLAEPPAEQSVAPQEGVFSDDISTGQPEN